MLEVHNIGRDRQLPGKLEKLGVSWVSPTFGAVLGVDIIQRANTGELAVLEANIFPGTIAYVDRHGLSANTEEVQELMYREAFKGTAK